uniref:Uncharacterized protein n=1 Tax=Setaria viridis TaxID=4556 RepID=A0A4U6UX25_SETVI|nr:hypothetical protein SEVIR_5G457350v2 [Setaria viridis]
MGRLFVQIGLYTTGPQQMLRARWTTRMTGQISPAFRISPGPCWAIQPGFSTCRGLGGPRTRTV